MDWTEEQKQAIYEDGKNIIVSAGAGSGKTTVLTARTIRIIKEGTHVNELLILTFTNAAAAEMKNRIRKAISGEPSLKKELELVDQAYITTFDSYALSVVKKYHYLLNISDNIAISESSIIDMKKQEIIDEVFNDYYESRPTNFTKLIKNFCNKSDKDIKNSIIAIADKIDAKPDREEYLNTYLDKYTSTEFYQQLNNEFERIIISLRDEVNGFYEDFISDLDEKAYNKFYDYANPLYNAKTYDEIYNAIKTADRFPSPSLDEDQKIKKELYKNKLDAFKKKINEFEDSKTNFEHLVKSKDYTSAIIDIVKEFLNRLHDYKAKNEIYDFQDIALLSIRILRENEDVRNEIKYSFKNIMVDEYQDTNDIQEAFISLIANNNVYIVGDVKQSIYRFRNANPTIFKDKYDEYSKGITGLKIDLTNNFRSRTETVKGINDIFGLVMDNTIGGADYQASHQMLYGNRDYLEKGLTDQDYNLEILEYPYDEAGDYDRAEIEIFTIGRDIQNKIKNKYQVFKDGKLRDARYEDFTILIDREKKFDLYKKIFEYLGIPLSIKRDEVISASEDIYILRNIIDFIVRIKKEDYETRFKYDFMSIARSYLYSYTDQEIFNYFLNNNFQESSVYNDFMSIANEINHLNTIELFERVINKTNMYEKLITVGDINSAMIRIGKLLDIANNLSKLGYNIYSFNDYLNELIDNEYKMKCKMDFSDSNAVKLMNIHKSKGLEFNICYYSGLSVGFNDQDIKESFIYTNRFGIIVPSFDAGIRDTIAKYLFKYYYYEDDISERIRLFYVALTRAKEKMIIIKPESETPEPVHNIVDINIRRAYKSFADILDSIKANIIDYYHPIDISNLKLSKEYLYNKTKETNLLSGDIEPLEIQEISIKSEEEAENKHFSKTTHELIDKRIYENMQLGLKAHEIFELLDFKNPDYSLIEDDFIKDKVTKFLSLDLLKDIKNSTIYKEHEFIYELDNTEYHGIIDLMVEYSDHIDIIDYKLNNVKDENYLLQLNGYKDYISTISNKEINIYLYSIIGETLEKL